MMSHKVIVGNWKMHTTATEAKQLAEAVAAGVGNDDAVSVTLCPPFVYLAMAGHVLKSSGIALGAQNLYPQPKGAFTGEVSAAMLLDIGDGALVGGASLDADTFLEIIRAAEAATHAENATASPVAM